MTPLVSVIVPCYKLGHLLTRCVKSVCAQTLDRDKWEVIIVDDASPDNTAAVADDLVATLAFNIRVIHNPVNKYLAGSLNVGVQAALGKYIMHLDADNEIAPTTLAELVGALERDREIDIAYGAVTVVEESGRRYKATNWPAQVFSYEAQINHQNQIPSTCVYRRKMWERLCGVREWCRHADDAEFWTKATTLGFVPRYVTSNPTLIYYVRHDSMSHTIPDWDWHNWVPKHSIARAQHTLAHTKLDARQRTWVRNNARQYPPKAPYISIGDPVQITVIIPVGPGHEHLLINAVDSVWRQDFDYWDCVVVADGVELPKLPPFARRTYTHTGHGPAVARNTGLKISRSPYVLFLDADDYLEPTALSTMWNALNALGADTTYVYTDWKEHDGPVHTSLEHDCDKLHEILYHPSTILVKRDAARFDEALDSWEDWDYMLQLQGRGVYGVRVPEPLVNVRMTTSLVKQRLIENKEQAIGALRNKWEGVDMPKCTSCGGRRYYAPRNSGPLNSKTTAAGSTATSTNGTVSANGAGAAALAPRTTVEIAYVGDDSPTIRGKSTGVMYYFYGAKPVIKNVFEGDVADILSYPGFMRATNLAVGV